MNDRVHASIPAIQNMELASARLARAVVDRLPSVECEVRQASDALEDRTRELRREISHLHNKISSADNDEDTSWESRRIEEAEEALASLRQRSRRLAEVSANYMTHASKLNHLATDHAIQTREFLRGTVDDLKAYFAADPNTTS